MSLFLCAVYYGWAKMLNLLFAIANGFNRKERPLVRASSEKKILSCIKQDR